MKVSEISSERRAKMWISDVTGTVPENIFSHYFNLFTNCTIYCAILGTEEVGVPAFTLVCGYRAVNKTLIRGGGCIFINSVFSRQISFQIDEFDLKIKKLLWNIQSPSPEIYGVCPETSHPKSESSQVIILPYI